MRRMKEVEPSATSGGVKMYIRLKSAKYCASIPLHTIITSLRHMRRIVNTTNALLGIIGIGVYTALLIVNIFAMGCRLDDYCYSWIQI